MATRPKCAACGNLTRFDVVRTTRTKGFHHFTVGGDLIGIEEEVVLDDTIEEIVCRWCGPRDSRVVQVEAMEEQA